MNKYNLVLLLVVAILFFFVGYLVKKERIIEKEIISYVYQEPIHISPIIPEPIIITKPTISIPKDVFDSSKYEFNKDSVISILSDSIELYRSVLNDYTKLNKYIVSVLRNDTIGDIDATILVEYNRIKDFDIDLRLKQKNTHTIIESNRKFSAGIGYNSYRSGIFNAQFGVIKKDIGIEASFIVSPDFKYKGYGLTLKKYF